VRCIIYLKININRQKVKIDKEEGNGVLEGNGGKVRRKEFWEKIQRFYDVFDLNKS
jgi:hypothetical protein